MLFCLVTQTFRQKADLTLMIVQVPDAVIGNQGLKIPDYFHCDKAPDSQFGLTKQLIPTDWATVTTTSKTGWGPT